MLSTLKALSPEGFERICQRLLREFGFQQVTVTGKSGDGGIDGHGILQINPLVSFKVLFQCKRYAGSAEQFIDRLASESSWTGKPYTITCEGVVYPSGDWLHQALQEYRKGL